MKTFVEFSWWQIIPSTILSFVAIGCFPLMFICSFVSEFLLDDSEYGCHAGIIFTHMVAGWFFPIESIISIGIVYVLILWYGNNIIIASNPIPSLLFGLKSLKSKMTGKKRVRMVLDEDGDHTIISANIRGIKKYHDTGMFFDRMMKWRTDE